MSTVVQPEPRGWSYPDDTSSLSVDQEVTSTADERRYARTQLELIWLKFLHNRAALIGGTVIIVLYLTAIFAGFLAPYDADQRFDSAIYVPPQPIYLVDDGKFYPHILGVTRTIDRETLRRTY
ncbi:MAG TPA: hypothetical protein VFH48_23840, partial [Chloroflexota bacterium]|nr:hypothetical protein [Chloroflexota bacterium]